MIDEILLDADDRMNKAISVTTEDFTHIRTGKATIALLDGVKVEAYDQLMPLNQVASINIPEIRLITIQPWDKTIIKDIEKSILKSELGLTPNNDGQMIRIAIPQLTEERRKELVKVVKKIGEDCKVSIRNIRRDSNEKLKKLEKDSTIREDDYYRALDDVQELTDKAIEKIDKIISLKEEEIMMV